MAEEKNNFITDKCGVVILNYNSHNLTVSLAEKIAGFESVSDICVVDNNSNDNFDSDFNHPKIHYIKNNINSGYSAGNNVGLRYLVEEKKCEYVFIANPDVIFGENSICVMRDAFKNDSRLALVSTKRFGHSGAKIHQYFDFPSVSTSVKRCFFLSRRKFEQNRKKAQNEAVASANKLLYVDAVPGAFFGIRSSFLKENNYLYEGIFLYGEELILGRQAFNMGYRAAVLNEAEYIHDHEQKRFSNRKMFWYDRKSLKIYYKMFEHLNVFKKILLNIAIVLGTAEYNCMYYIYKLLNGLRGNK